MKELKSVVETTRKVNIKVSEKDLVTLLELPEKARDIKAYVQIPSGGDYSGMRLDLNDCDLTVEYSMVEDAVEFLHVV